MIPPKISVGPLTVHLYGVIMAVAIFSGWLLAKKRAWKYSIPQHIFDDPILLTPLFLGITFARLYHVADYWDVYKENLMLILAINRGGLGIWGGLIGALIGFLLVAKVKKIAILSTLDLAAPSLLLGQALGRLANFINQEGFGPPTNAPWGIHIAFANRPAQFQNFSHFHPTFFYEAAIDALFLVFLLHFAERSKIRGQTFSLYLILYASGRFIVEFWRIDTWMIGPIKVAQILSVATFVLGLTLFWRLAQRQASH